VEFIFSFLSSAVAFLNTFSAIGKSISRLERQTPRTFYAVIKWSEKSLFIISPPDFQCDPFSNRDLHQTKMVTVKPLYRLIVMQILEGYRILINS